VIVTIGSNPNRSTGGMAWVVVARRRYAGAGSPLADPEGPGVGGAAEPGPEQAATMAATTTATAAIHLDIARSIIVAPPRIDPTATRTLLERRRFRT
jgi:hypothetical protein